MKKSLLIALLTIILVVSCLALTACHSCEFGEWTVATPATCTQIGQEKRVCSCGEFEVRDIPATGHSYTPVVTNPNCTEDGFTTHTCANCGDSYVDTNVQATGHGYQAVVTAPTCTQQGYTTHVCANCGDSYVDAYVDVLGHDEIQHDAKAPTCTEVGWHAYVTCSRCDYTTYNEIPATGHTEGQWIVDVEPGCTTEGSKHQVCTTCGATFKTEAVDATGHSYVSVVTDPTCTEQGYTTHTCSVCDYAYKDNYIQGNGIHNFQESDICGGCQQNIADVAVATYNISATTNDNVKGYIVFCPDGKYDVYIKGNGAMKDYYNTTPFRNYNYYLYIINAYIEEGVTSIGNYAFRNCSSLTSITIPEGVTSIGEDAFAYCSSLTSITIPDSVTSIGASAFSGCSSLTSINIPDSVTSIGEYAFYGCNRLTGVYITDMAVWCGITFGNEYSNPCCNIKANMYLNNKLVTDIVIPDGVTSIGNYSFYNCTSFTSITIPDSVTFIGRYVFYNCDGLTNITIPNGVTYIGKYAFYGCDGLTSITIPDGVTSIGDYAFYICSSLTSITIPNSVTSIGDFAIAYCPSLTSITIPDSVTSIGDYAFAGCKRLTSITIPDSVTSIGEGVIYESYSLTSVTCPVNAISSLSKSRIKNLVITSGPAITDGALYGFSSLESITIPCELFYFFVEIFGEISYTGSTEINFGSYKYYIPTSLKSVTVTGRGDLFGSAFADCFTLKSVTIEDGVTSIGNSAFADCEGLTSITIPDSVTSIGKNAFKSCRGLTNITIPEGVTSIGDYAFKSCSSLASIVIPGSLTSIGSDAFIYCNDLTSVYITDLEAWLNLSGGFELLWCTDSKLLYLNNKLVTDLVIPDGVASITDGAFMNCASLTSVTIPDSVTSIGGSAFRDCSSLTSITIPDGVTSIGGSAFFGCSSLTSITIPDGVTSIGNGAFSGCSSLTSITIPFVGGSIKTLGYTYQYPFGYIFGTSSYTGGIATSQRYYGSSASSTTNSTYYIPSTLKSVTVTGGNILYGAFSGCSSLASITILDGITSIGGFAFYNCTGFTSITIPDSVTSIGDYAFYNCTSLTYVEIGDSVTSIGEYAFDHCSSLASVEIGDSVTSIGEYAFVNCTSLTNVYITDLAAWCKIYFSASSRYPIVSHANPLCYADNLYLNNKLVTELVIPDSVTSIGDYAFSGCTSIRIVTISDGLKSIGKYAFDSCSNLTTVCYAGTQEQWNNISIGSNNSALTNANIAFSHLYHNYIPTVTSPTCTEQGYTSHTCYCGDSFVDTYVDALGHIEPNEQGKCDRCDKILICYDIASALIATTGTPVQLTGTVTGYVGTYKYRFYIDDADGYSIRVYATSVVNIGDVVKVVGNVGSGSGEKLIEGAAVTVITPHVCSTFVDATCMEPAVCTVCGEINGEPLGHTEPNAQYKCDRCNASFTGLLATFDFGKTGTAINFDGNDFGTSKTYTEDGYQLALTDMSKVFGTSYDAKGNSCIKLGTSSMVGTLTFTAPENATKVIIYVAGYKAKTVGITVNGTSYTISTLSNNGEYTAIEIDTTIIKTIIITTGSNYRCMIDKIEFWAPEA